MLANHPNVLSGGGVATNIIGGTGLFADGTAAAPSISFASDTDTGFYSTGAGETGYAANGASSLLFGSSGRIWGGATASAALLTLGTTGGITLTASANGSGNQSITLTPSGTGQVYIGNGTAAKPSLSVAANTGTGINFTVYSHTIGFMQAGVEMARFEGANGRFLLGTSVDSGNGILQLAAHTTSAGGIGFGTDVSLYRLNSAGIALTATGGAAISLLNSGSSAGYLATSGSSMVVGCYGTLTFRVLDGGTTALTLDASLNATFAGTAITLASAAAKAGLRIPHGAAPTSPTNGDMWSTTAGLFIYINGVTKTVTLT
jgi:hypothetical protein